VRLSSEKVCEEAEWTRNWSGSAGPEYQRLTGVLSLYCRDRHVAEELAQDTLIRVINNWGRVRQLGSPSAWAHRVAINLANSHLRRVLAERRARRGHRLDRPTAAPVGRHSARLLQPAG
jgi:DNA-directed RNA polymerase specialized sigma24 family protein